MGLILAGGIVVADEAMAEVSAAVVDSDMTSAVVVISGSASVAVCAAVVVTVCPSGAASHAVSVSRPHIRKNMIKRIFFFMALSLNMTDF